MGLGSFWCYVWWLTMGAFGGTFLWWLLDKLFLRDTETPRQLALAEVDLAELRAAHEAQLAESDELREKARTASVRAIENSSLRTQLEERMGLEQAFEAEYNKVVAERDGKAREVETLAASIARLKSELSESSPNAPELSELRSRFAALQTEYDAAQAKLKNSGSQSTAAVEAARQAAAAQAEELARVKAEWMKAAEHSAKAARLQQDLDQKVEQHRRLEGEMDAMKSVLLDSKRALERQSAEIARLRSELGTASAASGRETQLEAELASSRASETKLRDELTAATVRIANLERLRLALDAARQAAAELGPDANTVKS